VRQVAGVKDEGGGFGRSLDLRDGCTQRRCDVGVRRFVESDVGVADLDEAERTVIVRRHRGAADGPVETL
jgi:hypothetical protein